MLVLAAPVGLAARARDPRKTYPFVTASYFVGGAGHQVARAVIGEPDGRVLLAGEEAIPGATHRAVFVARLDAALLVEQRATIDGAGDHLVQDVALAPDGDVLIAGAVQGAALPGLGTGTPPHGGWDAFVVRLDRVTLGVVWTAFVGGSGTDRGGHIAVDALGRVVIAGTSCSADLPTTAATAPQPVHGGGCDAFAARLSADGREIEWCTYLGGSGDENVFPFLEAPGHVAMDATGSVYLAGSTESADLPVTEGAPFPTLGGTTDAFVARVDPDIPQWRYVTYFGGSGPDHAFGVAVTPAGQAWVVGRTESVDLPVARPFQAQIASLADAFVSRFSADGRTLEVASYLGGAGEGDRANAIVLDSHGTIFVGGTTRSTEFPGADPSRKPGGSTNYDGFLSRISPHGAMLHSWFLGGGTAEDAILDVALATSDGVLAAGYTFAAGFPVVLGTEQASFVEAPEGVVLRIAGDTDEVACTPHLATEALAIGTPIVLDALAMWNRGGRLRSVVQQLHLRLGDGVQYLGPWAGPIELAPGGAAELPGAELALAPDEGPHQVGCIVHEAQTGRFLGAGEVSFSAR